MATVPLIEYEQADRKVKAVYNDIRKTRGTSFINNFWRALANHPELLKRIWREVKQVMAPGAVDPLTKEMVYIAVSVANNCDYCIHSHTASARAKGMTDEQYQELIEVIGMAHQTISLVNGSSAPGAITCLTSRQMRLSSSG